MTERKLKLVHSAPPPADGDGGEPPITPEEERAAAELREALEQGDDALANSLRASWRSGALADADNEALLERALGDADAPPTAAEEREAAALAAALDRLLSTGAAREHDPDRAAVVEVASALRAAHAPRPLDPATNEALLAKALDRDAWRRAQEHAGGKAPGRPKRVPIVPITVSAVAGIVALAAAFALTFRADRAPSSVASRPASGAAPAAAAEASVQSAFIHARSTDTLFDPAVPFPARGGESARIDRIASARASDLRANRFAAWGVR